MAINKDFFKEMLIEELEIIKSKDMDKDGKLKVRSKEEVKQDIGRSPDFSDTLMMRMWFEYKKGEGEEMSVFKPRIDTGKKDRMEVFIPKW